MISFRIRYRQAGGHFHARVFSVRGPNVSELLGVLMFSPHEWQEFLRQVSNTDIEMLPE